MKNQPNTNANISEEDFRQLVRVAKLYYQYDFTQSEIGKRLGLSRIKIHRMLRAAKEAGIVKIQIDSENSGFFDEENELIVAYDLRDAIIVPSQETQGDLYLALAQGAVDWLSTRLKPEIRVGLGLGRTISHLPKLFEVDQQVDCIFTEVVGGASDYSQGFASYNITSKMADLAGGRAEFFYAPTYVSSPELKQNLIQEPSVKKALQNARQCDIVMQSIGPVDNSALLFVHEFITEDDLQQLKDKGAVGDALGHYFNQNGKSIQAFTDDHIIGIDLEDLRKVPWSVCIAGGSEKVPAISAALIGKIFNVLITDVETAKALIKEKKKHAA